MSTVGITSSYTSYLEASRAREFLSDEINSLDKLNSTSLKQIANGHVKGIHGRLDYSDIMRAGATKIALETLKRYSIPKDLKANGFKEYITKILTSFKLYFLKLYSIHRYIERVKGLVDKDAEVEGSQKRHYAAEKKDHKREELFFNALDHTNSILREVSQNPEDRLILAAKFVSESERNTVRQYLNVGFNGILTLGNNTKESKQSYNLAVKVKAFKSLVDLNLVSRDISLYNPSVTDSKKSKLFQRIKAFLYIFVSASTTIKAKAGEFLDEYAAGGKHFDQKIAKKEGQIEELSSRLDRLKAEISEIQVKLVDRKGSFSQKNPRRILKRQVEINRLNSNDTLNKELQELKKELSNLKEMKNDLSWNKIPAQQMA
jgi:hypothetical protein